MSAEPSQGLNSALLGFKALALFPYHMGWDSGHVRFAKAVKSSLHCTQSTSAPRGPDMNKQREELGLRWGLPKTTPSLDGHKL